MKKLLCALGILILIPTQAVALENSTKAEICAGISGTAGFGALIFLSSANDVYKMKAKYQNFATAFGVQHLLPSDSGLTPAGLSCAAISAIFGWLNRHYSKKDQEELRLK